MRKTKSPEEEGKKKMVNPISEGRSLDGRGHMLLGQARTGKRLPMFALRRSKKTRRGGGTVLPKEPDRKMSLDEVGRTTRIKGDSGIV